MRTTYLYFLAVVCAVVLSSCDDEEQITLQGFNENADIELITTQSNVELTADNSSDLALQFAWDISDFTLSKYSLAANSMTYELQFSLDSLFSDPATVSVSGSSCSFTGGTLNTAINQLSLEGSVSYLFYIRLSVSAGSNIDPIYSNVVNVTITPYEIDYTSMYLSTSTSVSDVFSSLYSPDEDGEYTGFVTTPSNWYNFYFISGDGTAYGNTAVSGTAFNLTTDASMWNCWFPGTSGCHYVTMSTNDMDWTATWVSSMTVSGDHASGTLSFSSSTSQWSGTVTATSDNANIVLQTTGNRYDKNSGDSGYSEYTFFLFGDGTGATTGTLSFSETETAGYIVVPEAGTYTLTIDLSDPKAYTYTLSEGTVVTPDYPDQLYLHDRSDADTYYATLYPRTDHVYECFYSGSAWQSFYFTSSTSMSEGTIYGYTGSNQYAISSASAENFSSSDLWAFWFDYDVANYYFIQANLESKTWTPEVVNGFYVTGNFNGWSTSANPMAYNSETKKWTATCEITDTQYGLQILPDISGEDDMWSNKMASVSGDEGSGELDWYSRTGSTNIPVPEPGTYVITIDLSNSGKYTYSVVKQ